MDLSELGKIREENVGVIVTAWQAVGQKSPEHEEDLWKRNWTLITIKVADQELEMVLKISFWCLELQGFSPFLPKTSPYLFYLVGIELMSIMSQNTSFQGRNLSWLYELQDFSLWFSQEWDIHQVSVDKSLSFHILGSSILMYSCPKWDGSIQWGTKLDSPCLKGVSHFNGGSWTPGEVGEVTGARKKCKQEWQSELLFPKRMRQ